MTLSIEARLYLTHQVFDAVNRRPLRFDLLEVEIPGLKAWPDYRYELLGDPRFLVEGDVIDIATAGLPRSAKVEEIVAATLDRARLPMRDQDLVRVVRRVAPSFAGDAIDVAIKSLDVFRPRTGHLARISWLQGALPVTLPQHLPDRSLEAVLAYLETCNGRVPAAGLAVAIALRFGITVQDAYAVVVDPYFLPLPDGSVCLYLPVEDEITLAVAAVETGKAQVIFGELESTVALKDLDISESLPNNLDKIVASHCLKYGGPITTQSILGGILQIKEGDPAYLNTLWAVNRALSLSNRVIPVGEHKWVSIVQIPGAVFHKVLKAIPSKEDYTRTPDESISAGTSRFNLDKRNTLVVSVSAVELDTGCLNDYRLGSLLPDTPLIQSISWDGVAAWYNAETFTIVGIDVWFRKKQVLPGDTLVIEAEDGKYRVRIKRSEKHSDTETRVFVKPAVRQHQQPSLLILVIEALTHAGGALKQEELLQIVQEEDPEITWESDLKPLFSRYPSLGTSGGWCFLNTVTGRRRGGGVLQAGILTLLAQIPEQHASLRSEPRIFRLTAQAAAAPRISAAREAVLIPQAKAFLQGRSLRPDSKLALEELVAGNMRTVIRYLFKRKDFDEIAPYFEDAAQQGCIGVMRAIVNYDHNRSPRLQNILGLYLRNEIDRSKPYWVRPVRFPQHFQERVEAIGRAELHGKAIPCDDEALSWLRCKFVSWEQLQENCENEFQNTIAFTTLVSANPDPETACIRADIGQWIEQGLNRLTPREARVIRERFGLDNRAEKTLEEISWIFGVTRERIRQIEKKALGKLARMKVIKEIRSCNYLL